MIIELKNITKEYSIDLSRKSLLREIVNFFGPQNSQEKISAVQDISISIKKGETVGIIGENGSGKTTLLRILSGITLASQGSLNVCGTVAGLLDMGAGFPSELSGRECIYLNAALFGLSREKTESIYDDIVGFSGIERFIDAKIKTYSQGMLVRLGFSIAAFIDSDIFLIDDTLAVGDEEFQRKCLKKIEGLKIKGKTIIVVSHDLSSISRICDRGLLLEDGKLIKDDSMQKVIVRYVESVGNKRSVGAIDQNLLSVIFNNGKIIILWDGKPLTEQFGGYLGFQVQEQWVMSWSADWDVCLNNSGDIEAKGVWHKYSVQAELKIKVIAGAAIGLEVKLSVPQESLVKNISIGLMVSEKYNKYLCGRAVKEIGKDRVLGLNWVDLYRTDENSSPLLLFGTDILPGIFMEFDRNGYNGFGLIQQTGQEFNAQVMQTQFSIVDEKNISAYANIQFLDKQQIIDKVETINNNRGLNIEKTCIFIEDKAFSLLYEGKHLTKLPGLKIGIWNAGYYLDIFDGQWSIEKSSDYELTINSVFKNLNLEMRASLKLISDELSWKITYFGADISRVEAIEIQAFFSQKYNKYIDINAEYEFISAGEYNEQVCVAPSGDGVIGLIENTKELSPVLFKTKGNNSQIELVNARFDVNARIICQKTTMGTSAQGEISILANSESLNSILGSEKKSLVDVLSLKSNDLKLEVSGDNLKIYWKDIEVTSGEGLSSGIYSSGRWFESTGVFKEFKQEGKGLKVSLKRKAPFINEHWIITLKDGMLNWEINFDGDSSAGMISKAGIILNSDFKKWIHCFSQGSFCSSPEDIDDINNRLLGAQAKVDNMPAVEFQVLNTDSHVGLIVQEKEQDKSLNFKFKDSFLGRISFLSLTKLTDDIVEYYNKNFTLTVSDKYYFLATSESMKLIFDDKELTKDKGLWVALTTDKGIFDSRHSLWRIKKLGPHKMEIELTWPGFDWFEENWVFEVSGNTILWTMYVNVKQEFTLKDLIVNFLADKEFSKWITPQGQGLIDICSGKEETVDIIDNESRFLCLSKEKISLDSPAVIFDAIDLKKGWFFHIYKDQDIENALVCGLHYIPDFNQEKINQDDFELFKMAFGATDTDQDIVKLKTKNHNMLEK